MDIFALYTLAKTGENETFQDSNNNNDKVARVVRKIKFAGTLLILYIVFAVIFHIMMTVITAFLAPSLKPLHTIGYFFFGTFWLCPMLIYYVLANGYTLNPSRSITNTFNNRRL